MRTPIEKVFRFQYHGHIIPYDNVMIVYNKMSTFNFVVSYKKTMYRRT